MIEHDEQRGRRPGAGHRVPRRSPASGGDAAELRCHRRIRVLIALTARGTGDVVFGSVLVAIFLVYSVYFGRVLVRRPPLVLLSTTGLAARPIAVGRMPDAVRWHTIRAFEIVRRRHAPLTPAQRFLAVSLETPNRARWQYFSGRWNVKRFGTPFVLPEYFLGVSLEAVVDAARAFTDAPLTYANDKARRPRERWRANRSG